MWTRRELKECAKQLLKINYWKAVLAGVILSLIGGSGVVSVVERSSSGSFDEVIGAVETDDFGLVLGIALGIVAVALLVNFIMTILIWNPLEVGCKKLFIQCEYGTAETRCIWSVINRRDGKNVVNLEKHRHELKNAVYKTMGDIAITLYVHAGTLKNGITYLKVRSEYLETWGLEKDDVLHDALLNSYRILSPRIYDFKKMMYTPGYAGDDFMNVDPYFISDKKKKEGICLSVKGLTNGAVAVLYPEVIKKLVELMDGDFYVVFSSVHEALIHSSKLCSLEELENLLRTSNSRMTFQKEFLTDKVYYYCREKDKFIMLQGSLKMLVTTIRMDEEN